MEEGVEESLRRTLALVGGRVGSVPMSHLEKEPEQCQ